MPYDPPIVYVTPRTRPLAELRASDVPRGLSPDDVATDGAGAPPEDFTEQRTVQRLHFVGTEETLDLHDETHPQPSVDIGLERVTPGMFDREVVPLAPIQSPGLSDIRPRRFNIIEPESLANVQDISDEFEAAFEEATNAPFLTEEIRGFEGVETVQLGHPPQPVSLNFDGELQIGQGGQPLRLDGDGELQISDPPMHSELRLDPSGIGFYGETPQAQGQVQIPVSEDEPQGNGGDIRLTAGTAPNRGDTFRVETGHYDPDAPVYGSMEWWRTRVRLDGAVFHIRQKPRTLPEARSSLLSVLEARAETAPKTWAERVMADDDEDG